MEDLDLGQMPSRSDACVRMGGFGRLCIVQRRLFQGNVGASLGRVHLQLGLDQLPHSYSNYSGQRTSKIMFICPSCFVSPQLSWPITIF